MENSFNFYDKAMVIKVFRFPVTLDKACWEDVELYLIPLIQEEGIFDNVHRCWQAALASVVKTIFEKKDKYKVFTINLNACEYYALRNIVDNTLLEPDLKKFNLGLYLLAQELNKEMA